MLTLLLNGGTQAAGPTTPSGPGGIPVVSAAAIHTIKGEPTSTIEGEKLGTVKNG